MLLKISEISYSLFRVLVWNPTERRICDIMSKIVHFQVCSSFSPAWDRMNSVRKTIAGSLFTSVD